MEHIELSNNTYEDNCTGTNSSGLDNSLNEGHESPANDCLTISFRESGGGHMQESTNSDSKKDKFKRKKHYKTHRIVYKRLATPSASSSINLKGILSTTRGEQMTERSTSNLNPGGVINTANIEVDSNNSSERSVCNVREHDAIDQDLPMSNCDDIELIDTCNREGMFSSSCIHENAVPSSHSHYASSSHLQNPQNERASLAGILSEPQNNFLHNLQSTSIDYGHQMAELNRSSDLLDYSRSQITEAYNDPSALDVLNADLTNPVSNDVYMDPIPGDTSIYTDLTHQNINISVASDMPLTMLEGDPLSMDTAGVLLTQPMMPQSISQQTQVDEQDMVTPMVNRDLAQGLRARSTSSVNLALDGGDVKRQIVMDESLANNILKDLICPICLEYFYFPVTVACGHTYCRYCIGHSKLAGKMCPLCRQPVGKTMNTNTILSNLVKSLNLRKRTVPVLRAPEMSQVAEKLWWDEHCLKPFLSVPLFLRIMLGNVAQTHVFFDDLCSCLMDYFTKNNKWSRAKWVFTLEDYRVIRNLVGFDPSDAEGSSIRLHNWVEDYLVTNPHLCFHQDLSYPLTVRVHNDASHKIEGAVFTSEEIPNKLPWDAGRHAKSLIHLPHSSVSLSHLIFTKCPDGRLGVLDCGSTIGTMFKLRGLHFLENDDRIHIGDKHEADVTIFTDSIGTPFRDYKWDPNTHIIMDHNECSALSLKGQQELVPLDSHLKLRIFTDSQVDRDVWVCPKGLIVGRGPATQASYRKLSITTQNGYISREHCLIYYDGDKPKGNRWVLRDMSTLGTYLKLKPFQQPFPLSPGNVLKIGQCKVEILNTREFVARRACGPSPAFILSQLFHSRMAGDLNGFSNIRNLIRGRNNAVNLYASEAEEDEENNNEGNNNDNNNNDNNYYDDDEGNIGATVQGSEVDDD